VFNGSSSRLLIGNPSSIRVVGDLTVEAWIKPTDYSVYHPPVTKRGANCAASWDWYLNQTSGVPTLQRGDGSTGVAGSHCNAVNGTTAPTTGVWSHIAATHTNNTATHYLNGATNGSGALNVTLGDTNTNAIIGSRHQLDIFAKGGLDEIRVANVALTTSWINAEYNNQLAPATFWSGGPTLATRRKVIGGR
jgi:hypothetical protein